VSPGVAYYPTLDAIFVRDRSKVDLRDERRLRRDERRPSGSQATPIAYVHAFSIA
jgi:hypothetical protein